MLKSITVHEQRFVFVPRERKRNAGPTSSLKKLMPVHRDNKVQKRSNEYIKAQILQSHATTYYKTERLNPDTQ